MYQAHGYGQLHWAQLNAQHNVSKGSLYDWNKTENLVADRLSSQWVNIAAKFMWGCHWDNGFVCPERQECYPDVRGLSNYSCNYLQAPFVLEVTPTPDAQDKHAMKGATIGA